ncbi:hypothetical protein AOA60_21745, partial [Pseudomonas sp. 2822-17]
EDNVWKGWSKCLDHALFPLPILLHHLAEVFFREALVLLLFHNKECNKVRKPFPMHKDLCREHKVEEVY